ncbi:hypothetical protein [Sphingomonas sp. PAMC 26621]|uniref:hypothetical protein n=1 Tax=Sphingomonas sp. PAMC 26621 TaxID=1112213 RepID=UPI000287BB3E|nr:hypothetical protein [Sphingomonas sp. PAMC 26621]
MKTPSFGALAIGLVGMATVMLFAIGTPNTRVAPPPPAPSAPPPSSVSAGGFSLASTTVDLPSDDAQYPEGPHADVINANCTACHSASMALNQPPLSADQWKAEVTKMREVYKAPVAEADVPAIVAYLTGMSAKLPVAATGKAQDPDPKAAPDVSGGSG